MPTLGPLDRTDETGALGRLISRGWGMLWARVHSIIVARAELRASFVKVWRGRRNQHSA